MMSRTQRRGIQRASSHHDDGRIQRWSRNDCVSLWNERVAPWNEDMPPTAVWSLHGVFTRRLGIAEPLPPATGHRNGGRPCRLGGSSQRLGRIGPFRGETNWL